MAKQKLLNQRNVLKIKSEVLVNNGMVLEIDIETARKNEMLVSVGASQLLVWMDELNGNTYSEERVKSLKQEIKVLRGKSNTVGNKKALESALNELEQLLFVKDYVAIEFTNKKHYDKANQGFTITMNGVSEEYVRLMSTSGGVKKSTIIYTRKSSKEFLLNKINNGRNMEKHFVAGKLSAYMGLTTSSSTPVSNPLGKVLVVKDTFTKIVEDVIYVSQDINDYEPTVETKYGHEMELNVTDGFGLISPEQCAKWSEDLELGYVAGGMCVRCAWTKGMCFPMDFVEFVETFSPNNYMVTDVWGNEVDIREVSIILTESMLKLHDSYSSWNDYWTNCLNNGYTFRVTKAVVEELKHQSTMNYQFLQVLNLNDEQIEELVQPTINHYTDILGRDYLHSLLYVNGTKVNDKNVSLTGKNLVDALMTNPHMINDSFIRQEIKDMIKKSCERAMTGSIYVNGDYQIVACDPICLMQNILGLEVKGLLGANEVYSKYWSDKDVERVAVFRAPQTNRYNMTTVNVKATDEMKHWYRYMNNVIIINGWDSLAQRANGLDFDSDTLQSTDNPIIIAGIEPTLPIICEQKAATKKLCTERDFIESDKLSFGDEIGIITNKGACWLAKQSEYEVGSPEWLELEKRIICTQHYQQLTIDRAKGIVASPMPKHWTNEKQCTNEFDAKLVADKKPYFMKYLPINKEIKSLCKSQQETFEFKCAFRLGLTVDELLALEERTPEQEQLYQEIVKETPVIDNDSVMNKICKTIEAALNEELKKRPRGEEFDYTIMKSKRTVNQATKDEVIKIYNEYKRELDNYNKHERLKFKRNDSELDNSYKNKFLENFKIKCMKVCVNEFELANILIDLAYNPKEKKKVSPKFCWMMCEDTIIKNLLANNNNKITYLTASENNSVVEYLGQKFEMKTVEVA